MLHGRMLRYLDVVARVGSIRKAATVLNVASSAINRQIIALEEELGEPLFERMPRRLRLTATGEVLIEHVRATLKAHTHTLERIEAMRGLHRGTITLATSFGLAAGPMAQIFARSLRRSTVDASRRSRKYFTPLALVKISQSYCSRLQMAASSAL